MLKVVSALSLHGCAAWGWLAWHIAVVVENIKEVHRSVGGFDFRHDG